MRRIRIALLASVAISLLVSAPSGIAATLNGQVTSAKEGAMEGVLISAKKDGSTVTTTVVSGSKGQFSFPAGFPPAITPSPPAPSATISTGQEQLM